MVENSGSRVRGITDNDSELCGTAALEQEMLDLITAGRAIRPSQWFELTLSPEHKLGSFLIRAEDPDQAYARLRERLAHEDPRFIASLADLELLNGPVDLMDNIHALLAPEGDFPQMQAVSLGRSAVFDQIAKDQDLRHILYSPSNFG